VALEIAEIADRHVAQDRALADRGVSAEFAAFEFRGGMDAWLGGKEAKVVIGGHARRLRRGMRAGKGMPAPSL
jgi:hypothetical protein